MLSQLTLRDTKLVKEFGDNSGASLSQHSQHRKIKFSHLGLHVWAAGVGAKSRQVAQRLGLLLEGHDAVLLEHPRTYSLSLLSHHPRVFSTIHPAH